jgi:hypothetical protein
LIPPDTRSIAACPRLDWGYSLVMTGRVPEGIALLRDAIEQTARHRRTDETR